MVTSDIRIQTGPATTFTVSYKVTEDGRGPLVTPISGEHINSGSVRYFPGAITAPDGARVEFHVQAVIWGQSGFFSPITTRMQPGILGLVLRYNEAQKNYELTEEWRP